VCNKRFGLVRDKTVKVETVAEDRTSREVKRLCYAGFDEATLLREVAEWLRSVLSLEVTAPIRWIP
jgi:hypothetical protein